MIRVEFTQAEYRQLLELMYLGDWVANATKVPGEEPFLYEALGQKILAQARDAGCGDCVEEGEESGELFPSRIIEEACDSIIANYDNDSFWEELPARLAERDVERVKGEGALSKMTGEQRLEEIGAIEDDYKEEFETHGLDRLEIVESDKISPSRRVS